MADVAANHRHGFSSALAEESQTSVRKSAVISRITTSNARGQPPGRASRAPVGWTATLDRRMTSSSVVDQHKHGKPEQHNDDRQRSRGNNKPVPLLPKHVSERLPPLDGERDSEREGHVTTSAPINKRVIGESPKVSLSNAALSRGAKRRRLKRFVGLLGAVLTNQSRYSGRSLVPIPWSRWMGAKPSAHTEDQPEKSNANDDLRGRDGTPLRKGREVACNETHRRTQGDPAKDRKYPWGEKRPFQPHRRRSASFLILSGRLRFARSAQRSR